MISKPTTVCIQIYRWLMSHCGLTRFLGSCPRNMPLGTGTVPGTLRAALLWRSVGLATNKHSHPKNWMTRGSRVLSSSSQEWSCNPFMEGPRSGKTCLFGDNRLMRTGRKILNVNFQVRLQLGLRPSDYSCPLGHSSAGIGSDRGALLVLWHDNQPYHAWPVRRCQKDQTHHGQPGRVDPSDISVVTFRGIPHELSILLLNSFR